MLAVVALVGRPNVGKSTLFNQLTKTQDALVLDLPGTTRDRQYGHAKIEEQTFLVVDTGGLVDDPADAINAQADIAILQADQIWFLVDGQAGCLPDDIEIAKKLRRSKKPIHLLVNKIDGLNPELAMLEFYELGFSSMHAIAAISGRGVTKLTNNLMLSPEYASALTELHKSNHIRVAVVGQPNVGKSTLVNQWLGENRMIVADEAGTTRDSIAIDFNYKQQDYTLIDTAGVRRKNRIKTTIEKFSVVKTLQSIEAANVVAMLFDATQGVVEQDKKLLSFIVQAGKALVIVVNKTDLLTKEQVKNIKQDIAKQLEFVNFAKYHFVSALNNHGLAGILHSVNRAYAAAMRDISTHKLTTWLQSILAQNQPPLVNGRRVKLRYAHMGGHNPPRIIVHGNQAEELPSNYKRYLLRCYHAKLKLEGTPLVIEFKTNNNPFAQYTNRLTTRQYKKRQRMQKKR